MGSALKHKRDEAGVSARKEDGDEFRGAALRVAQLLGDEVTLPEDAEPAMQPFVLIEEAQVRFGAGNENECRLADLLVAARWPAFCGRLLVLIGAAVDAIGAESVGERQDSIEVFGGIVAVLMKIRGGSGMRCGVIQDNRSRSDDLSSR